MNIAGWSMITLWAALTFSSALVEISFMVALISWIIWRLWEKPSVPSLPPNLIIALGLFLIFVVISCFTSEFPKISLRGLLKICQQLMIFIIALDLLRMPTWRSRFEISFLTLTAVVCLNGFFQYYAGHDFIRGKTLEPSGAGPRVSASFGTYGKLGAYLLLTIPYLIALGVYSRQIAKNWSRWYLIMILFSAASVLLFLTKSRGAFIALFAGTSLVLLFKRQWIVLLILGLMGIGFITILPKNMVIHLDHQLKEQSLIERFYLWDRAIQVIKAKPLTGTGINTYASAHAKFDTRKNWRVLGYYAHNGFLQLAAEIGIPGLLSFMCFLGIYFFFSMFRQPALPNVIIRWGALAGLLNFLAFSLVDTVLHNPQPVMTFWFMMGLQLAYLLSEQNKLQ